MEGAVWGRLEAVGETVGCITSFSFISHLLSYHLVSVSFSLSDPHLIIIHDPTSVLLSSHLIFFS